MLDLEELEYFVAFAECGTLAKVADKYHISTPSMTRSMQNLEKCFGVKLFERQRNKMTLNETGQFALVYASTLPCFTTDYIVDRESVYADRLILSIADEDANICFFLYMKSLSTSRDTKDPPSEQPYAAKNLPSRFSSI